MARTIDLHVMMLPWCAFGHLIPFFQLSIALAKSGVHISFISTPKNIKRLPKISPNLQTLIQFIELPMPILQDGSLPEGAEATVDVPSSKTEYLKISYDLLQHPLNKFIAEQKPNWIIIDLIPYWIAEIADENQVRIVHFSVFSASAYLFLCHPECLVVGTETQKKLRPSWESLTSKPGWIDFTSSLAYTKKEAMDVFQWIYSMNASGVSDGERVHKVLSSCQAMLIRSCGEIEGEYLNTWQKVLGKPVIPAGLLPPEKRLDHHLSNDDDSWRETFEWLDQQREKSVVYVAFGSEYMLSKDQVFEIAYGLELSGLSFLWALRKPVWAKEDIDSLPPGFIERTRGKGVVSMGWAPQMEILGHASIGGTLFHSGWGSIIEMLQFGHTLVLLPFIIDQPLNARFLVEKGLGVEVERNEEDGSFTRDGLAKALTMAMVGDERKNLRARASQAAGVFGDEKLHNAYYITKFVEFLKTNEYHHEN